MPKKAKQLKKATQRRSAPAKRNKQKTQPGDHSLTPDDLFDDCAVCQATKAALEDGRELGEVELAAAFKAAGATEAIVGGSLLEPERTSQPADAAAASEPAKELKLSLTKDELHALLELVSLGHSVAQETLELDESASVHESVYDRVLERAYWLGATDEVEPDGPDSYAPTLGFRDHVDETWLLPYDDATFWHELHERLTHRDIEAEFGALGPRAEPAPGELARLKAIWEQYEREFEAHGLDRLHIKKQSDDRPGSTKKPQ